MELFEDVQLFVTSSGNPFRSDILSLCSPGPLCTSVMGLVTLPCYHCFVSALNKELLKIRDNVVFICGPPELQVLASTKISK